VCHAANAASIAAPMPREANTSVKRRHVVFGEPPKTARGTHALLESRLQQTLERFAVIPKHNQCEHRGHDGDRQAFGLKQNVKQQDVHDHRAK
jgi:hypothetical protein